MNNNSDLPLFIDTYFENSAYKYPNAIAFKNAESRMTYSEVDKLSNQLAHFLIEKGIATEENVVVLFDLIKIDSDTALNDNCTMQTHLVEDRVMKMSYVDIGKNCSMGGMAVVLYDSKMEDNSSLEPLSVLMKSETLPANNVFIGAPAKKL